MFELDAAEQRVLGTLIEKQLATPQYYPLTPSALLQGCNQSTSREPVTDYSEGELRDVIARLKDKQLIRTVLPSHGRSVERFGHRLDEQLPLIKEEVALLGVLLLRGPQTVNELRTRTERLATWEPPDTVETILGRLAGKPEPLAQNIGRGPGRREDRWVHLLGPVDATTGPVGETRPAPTPANNRLEEMEQRVAALEAEIAELKRQLGL